MVNFYVTNKFVKILLHFGISENHHGIQKIPFLTTVPLKRNVTLMHE